jgi:hypothetical protein
MENWVNPGIFLLKNMHKTGGCGTNANTLRIYMSADVHCQSVMLMKEEEILKNTSYQNLVRKS